MPDIYYLNALYTIPGLGAATLRQLYGHFQSGEAAWHAPSSELEAAGIGPTLAKTIIDARLVINPENEWAKLEKENIWAVFFTDDSYPDLLKEISTAPPLLYLKGNASCLDMPCIAVIGSRKFTPYGLQAAQRLSYDLAHAGICVVSGLALGIDSIAHRGALDARGKTIAVLGNSLDDVNIYPRINFALAQEIIRSGGLLVSEFPIPTIACKGTFPQRNRIIAGLSLGTVVVEAAEKSGSLITANDAIEFNREVFSVPGTIFSPQSEGTNKLIKRGAKLTTSVSDILEELRLDKPKQDPKLNKEISLGLEEKKIADVLSPDPTHIDRIIKLTKLETSSVISTLSVLEIKGVIKNIGGQNYVRL
ncbi:MAG TPA: DNA-processing protein DprA [Patescibacteria group bacterium]